MRTINNKNNNNHQLLFSILTLVAATVGKERKGFWCHVSFWVVAGLTFGSSVGRWNVERGVVCKYNVIEKYNAVKKL